MANSHESDSMDVLPTGEGVLIIDEVKVIPEVILIVNYAMLNQSLCFVGCRKHSIIFRSCTLGLYCA